MIDPMQYAGLGQTPAPPQLNFAPMQMGQMKPNNQNQMTQAILQAALRGGSPGQGQNPQNPAPGQIMPGGAMNITPQQSSGLLGMLGGLFRGQAPQAPGVTPPVQPMGSADALY
jgi:hypothetical protein